MDTGKSDQSEEFMMRCNHRVAGWRPVAAIGAAAVTAGMMLVGGIGVAVASTPIASASVANSRQPALQHETVLAALAYGDPDDGGQSR